jgi:hypothetical protein
MGESGSSGTFMWLLLLLYKEDAPFIILEEPSIN